MRAWLVVLLLSAAGCTCGEVHIGGGDGGMGGGAGGGAGGGGGGGGGGSPTDGGCATACVGSVCIAGSCCATASVCGDECCASSETCLFSQCVTPGRACQTANDCAMGEYCETALGTDGGTVADAGADGGACTQPLPLNGRCLARPPVCADGGVSDGGCLEACEYRGTAGPLTAVQRWAWGPTARVRPNVTDVWSTPAVGRLVDANCDSRVDELDPPNVVFVSGRAINATTGLGTCCQCTGAATSACLTGVLRVLDGRTGQEAWSLEKASGPSIGFAGVSVALGDLDADGSLDIVAVTGEGFVVMVDAKGTVRRTSDLPIPGNNNASFGWGGGLSIADMDNDGFPEIAYGPTVFTTTNNAITRRFSGTGGRGGGGVHEALSTFVDLDGLADNHLELLAGNTAYRADGTTLWNRTDLADGFPGVGDFNGDGQPDVVLVTGGTVTVLNGATGVTSLPARTLGGTGFGGPPTVADFDGDGRAEIGVAQANFYTVLKPDYSAMQLNVLWQKPNHDLSSSVTGSSVFDFEGDGRAEVIYADECFLWVFDGPTGNVRFATSHTSFTATEASLVADVDGDGRAEILMISNGADPSNAGWRCKDANNAPTVVNGVAWVPGPAANQAYRGVALFGDSANSWVGTRTLWNQHTYHVSNICDDRDSACMPAAGYGKIPTVERRNWTVPWLNNFRQNVQDRGLFDAPDPSPSLAVDCVSPLLAHVFVRNLGLASLPAGVEVAVFVRGTPDTQVALVTTTRPLSPGQTEELTAALSSGGPDDTYFARVLVDPQNPTFHECRAGNNESPPVTPVCIQ
ncbi:MAG: VCBS repeat-containing protein [Myxococcota bacterium]